MPRHSPGRQVPLQRSQVLRRGGADGSPAMSCARREKANPAQAQALGRGPSCHERSAGARYENDLALPPGASWRGCARRASPPSNDEHAASMLRAGRKVARAGRAAAKRSAARQSVQRWEEERRPALGHRGSSGSRAVPGSQAARRGPEAGAGARGRCREGGEFVVVRPRSMAAGLNHFLRLTRRVSVPRTAATMATWPREVMARGWGPHAYRRERR
jgi:hypothetical protein